MWSSRAQLSSHCRLLPFPPLLDPRSLNVYVWEEEWTVIYRDDVDGDSPILIHEIPSAESSHNVQTYELPDTVWRRNEHEVNS